MNSDKEIELSVIIPIYKVERYLRKCLDSVLNQNYDNMEIICVNDGSPDMCGSIVDEYAERDSRIIHLKKENGGLVSARKAGIAAAKGRYVSNIDSDDWIEPGMYLKMMSILEKQDIDVICSGIIRDYGDYVKEEKINFDEGLYSGNKLKQDILSKMVDKHFMKYNIAPHLVTKICKKELFEEAYLSIPDETNLDEDVISLYPMLLRCNSVYLIKDCFYHYCSRESSIVNTLNKKETERIDAAYSYLKKQFEKYGEDVPNIMQQYQYLETYARLFVQPEKVLSYQSGRLNPYGTMIPNSKVVIYGTGSFFGPLYRFIEEKTDLNIVAVADGRGDGAKILRAPDLKQVEYDYILISVILADIVDAIIRDLLNQGVDESKILYIYKEVI